MKRPSFQFYPGDWLQDAALRTVSVGARGLWIEMLCYMHQGSTYGYLKVNHKVILTPNLTRMVGATLHEVEGWLNELADAGVYSVDADGAIFSKRMIRDEEVRKSRAEGGKLGGNPKLIEENKVNLPPNLKPTPSSASASSSSKPLTTTDVVVSPVVIDNPETPKNKTPVLIKTTVDDETRLGAAWQAACRETWRAYSLAYASRYKADPVRNETVNAQIKKFVKRIGFSESPQVAAFYVTNNAAFYVKKMHSVGMLLTDAEKLRTEWATNKRVTDTEARQADKTQAIGGVFQELIEEARERKRNAATA